MATSKRGAFARSGVDIDVADARYDAPELWMDESNGLWIAMEELHPADPGELSGARLWTGAFHDGALLTAYLGNHMAGCVDPPVVCELLRRISKMTVDETQSLTVRLTEPDREGRPNGMELRFQGGATAAIHFYSGSHCFGVARGPMLHEFLRRLSARASCGVQGGNITSITAAPRLARPTYDLPCAG